MLRVVDCNHRRREHLTYPQLRAWDLQTVQDWRQSFPLCLRWFELEQFKPGQFEAIQAILEDRDVFIYMATGAGKTLIFQMGAIISHADAGLTIIFSPLKALMRNHAERLEELGILPYALYHGDLSDDERQRIRTDIRMGHLAFIYITPESFFSPDMMRLWETMAAADGERRIARFVVDEAHYVLRTGEHFRQRYARLRDLRGKFPGVPIAIFTATATPTMVDDLIDLYNIQGCRLIQGNLDRPNIRYSVVWRSAEQDKAIAQLCRLFQNSSHLTRLGPENKGLIYCTAKKTCEAVSEALRGISVKAEPYYADSKEPSQMRRRWNQWMNEHDQRVQLLVATKVIGVGVDHPCLRFVIHFDPPDSLVAYSQESGRGGRDNLPAEAIMFFMPRRWYRFIEDSPEHYARGDVELAVNQYAIRNKCRRQFLLHHLDQQYTPGLSDESGCGNCDNCFRRKHKQRLHLPVTDVAKQLLCLLRDANRLHRQLGDQSKPGVTLRILAQLFLDKLRSEDRTFYSKARLPSLGCGAEAGHTIEEVECIIAYLELSGAIKTLLVAKGHNKASYLEVGPHASTILSGPEVLNIDFSVLQDMPPDWDRSDHV